MKAIDKKDTAESTSRKLKGASNRRTTRKIYDPSKDMPFNKGGMPKKNHAKPGSYSKAYMMGGMAKKKKIMWTPIVLMCSMYVTTECATYGGPIFKTEAACYQGMEDVGLPYLRQKVS